LIAQRLQIGLRLHPRHAVEQQPHFGRM